MQNCESSMLKESYRIKYFILRHRAPKAHIYLVYQKYPLENTRGYT